MSPSDRLKESESIVTSPDERLQAAWTALGQLEESVKRLEHLTDDELRLQMLETATAQQQFIKERTANHATFVRARGGLLHTVECPTMSHTMNRHVAWRPRRWSSVNARPYDPLRGRGSVKLSNLPYLRS